MEEREFAARILGPLIVKCKGKLSAVTRNKVVRTGRPHEEERGGLANRSVNFVGR